MNPPPGHADTRRSVRWLQALNFTIADVQNGMGPYVALFLQSAAQWNPAQIGAVLAFGNVAQVMAQTPTGVLIDRLHHKRALLAAGIVLIAIACLVTARAPGFAAVAAAQVLVGVAGSIFPPLLAALTLGLVGRARMDRQMGTNQAFNAAGNLFAAVVLGAAGWYASLTSMFYVVVVLAAVSLLCVARIRSVDIDHALARGADGEDAATRRHQDRTGPRDELRDAAGGLRALLAQRSVRVFLLCTLAFHFANAAMVPLVTQMLAKDQGAHKAVLYTSAYIVASQFVFVVVAAVSGRLAASLGRKPLFLFAFAALALRGVLYTLGDDPLLLIAVQCMDGLGAGVFGVVSVLVIADLTKGSGRFNAAQGAVATAVGVGAFCSNAVAGWLAHAVGVRPAFWLLAAIALCGFLLYALCMPETRVIAHDEAGAGPAPLTGATPC